MPNSIFISYRRLDAQHATFAIADRLRWAFGGEEVFFDRGSIRAGNLWPDSLRHGLAEARVFVPVMGEAWLRTADEWGRRRIDDEHDWVRQEVLAALKANAAGQAEIVPVLLEKTQRLRAEAVDVPLQHLASFEPHLLGADNWEQGLEELIQIVARKGTLSRIASLSDRNPNGSPARPRPVQRAQQPMTDAEVRDALLPLARWQLQWGAHAWGAGGYAQEIMKSYDFSSFAETIAFMADAARAIDAWKPPHHPRWENQWKVLNVFFTTWDVNCRVTKLDIKAAQKFDELVTKWRASGPSQ